MSKQRFSKKASFLLAALLSLSVLTSCSSESADDVQESAVSVNPLAELTFATNSSDAYNRSCYWGSQGNNIFMYQRMTEGNELAIQEGKLPIAGVEQAMGIVLQEGEPQAPEEYAMIKDFCSILGFQFNN
jgi:hypothetical protein